MSLPPPVNFPALPIMVKYRPLVLITGFLGAGKTTFLRDLLQQIKLQNLTADVILNDYENAALDAETLHGKAESIAPLAASCACCDGLIREKTLLGWLAALPDAVYRTKALVSLVDSPQVRHLFERVAMDVMPRPVEVPISPRVPPSAILIGPKLDPTALLELSQNHLGPMAKFPEEPAHAHV